MLSIHGEEASQNSTLEPWLVSPMAFSGDEAYSELFPLLILDSFPENITRITTLEENTLLYINQLKKYNFLNFATEKMYKLYNFGQ